MKQILLVRHAVAYDRDDWAGHDFDRPLTEKGIEKFKNSMSGLKKIVPSLTAVYSSGLLRSLQTAQILCDSYSVSLNKEAALNHGNLPRDIEAFIKRTMNKREGVVAFVGHEPELCLLLSLITPLELEDCFFKKGGMALLELGDDGYKLLWKKKNKELRKL